MTRKILTLAFLMTTIVAPAFAKHGADDRSSDDRGGKRGGSSSDDSNSNRNGTKSPKSMNARYRFDPAAGFETSKIKTSLKVESSKSRNSSVAGITKFSGAVELPIPTEALGVTTADNADAVRIHFVFTRGGTDYADCVFRFDADEDELTDDTRPRAEYRLELEKKKNSSTIRSKKGRCDTNLTRDGVQKGIPAISTGDSVRAEAVVGAGRVVFAQDSL